MSKHLDTSNTNNNGASKEDAKLPFMLPPLTSADLTTVGYYRSEEDNRIDGRLPETQTSFKTQKLRKTDIIEAKAGAEEQQAKNAPATTNSKTASMHTKYVEDKGSKFVPKADPVEPTLKDSALAPTQKQNVARASSQFYIEKLAVDAQSTNRKEKKTTRRTNKNNNTINNKQRIVNYARSKRNLEKKLPISENTAETNSDDVNVSRGDEGKRDSEHSQETLPENDKVIRPGAFAVSGIGGGSGNNTWESLYDAKDEEDDSIVEDESQYFVEALDEEAIQESICRHIIMEAVEAADVVVVNDDEEKAKQMKYVLYWIFALLTVLGTVIGFSIGLTRKNENAITTSEFPSVSPTLAPTRAIIPTLDTIQNNGKVRCGTGYMDIIETDLCRALAAAVLGDPGKIDLVTHTLTSRWEALANESLDVVILPSTYTMSRDVYQRDTKAGFAFSAPIFHHGVLFGGIPEYVDCADRLDTYFGSCRKVRICVPMGSSFHYLLTDYVADFNIHPVDNYEMFIKGKCNVFGGNSLLVAEQVLRNEGYTGDYKLGKTIFLREPLSMVTREDDKQWSDFVNWVFRSLLAAEEQNITHNTASKFMTTTVFGDKYKDMFVNAIEAVGNYGDLYTRHMEAFVPRDSIKFNLLNNGSTGLHFAYPLGEFTESPDPIAGSTIHSITKKEGKLRCGIFDRGGFGKAIVSNRGRRWQGMDADYCYALSASLFEGDTNKVAFVNLTNAIDGFQALDNGLVDVVAGVPCTLEGDVNETSTGKGYTFSMPYFYGDEKGQLVEDNVSEIPEGALSLITREDDSQWSDFVFWTVSATFIAEEEYITQYLSNDMVGISAFGPSFVDMHRHAIGAVGNYGEIYSRNVESIIPRQGRNLLNSNPFGPQQFSFF